MIAELLSDANAGARQPENMGPYLDNAFFDRGPSKDDVSSSVFTHTLNVVYIIFEEAGYDKSVLDAIARILAGGKGAQVGVLGS